MEMTKKDKAAYNRKQAEYKLHKDISELIRKFSETYDVELAHIDVYRNPYERSYNVETSWNLTYMDDYGNTTD